MVNSEEQAFAAFTTASNGRELRSWIQHGLTKREYFAAMALIGISGSNECHHDPMYAAGYAVEIADALIQKLAHEKGSAS